MIRVGGATEVEVKERKGRVDDAMHATRAAVEEGILPGGGVALLRAGKALEKVKDKGTASRWSRRRFPGLARQIAISPTEDCSMVVGKIQDKDTYAYGYDAQRTSSATWCPRGSSIRCWPPHHDGSDGCRVAEEAGADTSYARW